MAYLQYKFFVATEGRIQTQLGNTVKRQSTRYCILKFNLYHTKNVLLSLKHLCLEGRVDRHRLITILNQYGSKVLECCA